MNQDFNKHFIDNYNTITLLEMIEYIETNHPNDRKKMAESSVVDGRLNFFKFKNNFYQLYFPEKFEKKTPPSTIVLEWLNQE